MSVLALALDEVRQVVERHGRLGSDSVAVAEEVEVALTRVMTSLGPVPSLLAREAVDDARAARPDLVGADPALRLAVPPDAVLYAPVARQRRMVDQLERMNAPDIILDMERATLAALEQEPAPPAEWHRVFVLRDGLADWPGYWRIGELSIHVARRVLQAWTHVFPGDDSLAELCDDAAAALAAGCHALRLDLRDAVSTRSYEVGGPAGAALRAALAAHDRVTQNPKHDDQTELEYHAEHAWDAPGDSFARWWIEEVAHRHG